MYQEKLSSSKPGLIIFMIDQSSSMLDEYANSTKAKVATLAINRAINEIIFACANGDEIIDRCYVAVIGYGSSVEVLFLEKVSDLAKNTNTITLKKSIPDGAGGQVDVDEFIRVFLQENASNGTPMARAFHEAYIGSEKFISSNPFSFPPIIINITDGAPNDIDDTLHEVTKLAKLKTTDGNVIIMNAHIGEISTERIELPNKKSKFRANKFANFLFDISSIIPDSLARKAKVLGYDIRPNSRGLVFNADAETLIKLINFGSSAFLYEHYETGEELKVFSEEITITIQKDFKNAFKQYLVYFEEFVSKTRKKNIVFEVKTVYEGLEILIEAHKENELAEVGLYLQDYVSLIGKNVNEIEIEIEAGVSSAQAQTAIVELRTQIRNLQNSLDIKQLEIGFQEREINYLKEQTEVFQSLLREKYQLPSSITIQANSDSISLLGKEDSMASSQNANYDLRGARFGGGFATEGGHQSGGQFNDYSIQVGANIDEINNLIRTLRTRIQFFPEEQKTDINIELQDLEADLADERKREPKRLSKHVRFLWLTACTIAVGIAGAADFSNNLLELSEKLNVPIPLELVRQNPHILPDG